MRIALLTSSLAPYRISGAERQAVETAIRLAKRGHEVTVFARKMLPHQPTQEDKDGVRWICCAIIHIPGLSFVSHIGSFLRAWNREVRQRPFDCVLAYSMVINGVLGRLVAPRRKIPLVVSVRSEAEITLRQYRKFNLFTPWVLKRTDHVLVQAVAIREHMLFEMEATGNGDLAERLKHRSSVLANAIAIGPTPSYRNRKGLVFVGRLLGIKGVEILFQAMRLLDTPPELHLVGDGPLRRELEEAGKDLPCTFHGYLQPEEVAKRIRQARILVAPSYVEGFPNVVLEGMVEGVPVIASDVGGVSTLVEDGHNGYLLQPGNVEQLAQKLKLLLADDSLWEKMAMNARQTAKVFDWDPHLDNLETVLKSVVED